MGKDQERPPQRGNRDTYKAVGMGRSRGRRADSPVKPTFLCSGGECLHSGRGGLQGRRKRCDVAVKLGKGKAQSHKGLGC